MHYWAVTDPGCVRSTNQDALAVEQLDKHTLLCVVCDGMGGAKSGNVASSVAAEVFTKELLRSYKGQKDRERLEQMLEKAARLANHTVFEQARVNPDFEGMGTTLVAALVKGKQVAVVNVGDSRLYRINDEIKQITEDHSLVQMMLRRGELTREQAKNFPGKNYITRAIGTEPTVDCDFFHLDMKKDECLLLCSDGLSNLLDEQEMLFEVAHGAKMDHCCQRLRDIAIKRGAPDNVTSILIQI